MPKEVLAPYHLKPNRCSCGENSHLLKLSNQMNSKKLKDSAPVLSSVLCSDAAGPRAGPECAFRSLAVEAEQTCPASSGGISSAAVLYGTRLIYTQTVWASILGMPYILLLLLYWQCSEIEP